MQPLVAGQPTRRPLGFQASGQGRLACRRRTAGEEQGGRARSRYRRDLRHSALRSPGQAAPDAVISQRRPEARSPRIAGEAGSPPGNYPVVSAWPERAGGRSRFGFSFCGLGGCWRAEHGDGTGLPEASMWLMSSAVPVDLLRSAGTERRGWGLLLGRFRG
jgi:hypothetical protein